MTALIVKVSKDGTSREYLFSKLGPITIGSDELCDIRLEGVEKKILELRLSAGTIFIKEVDRKEKLFLDNQIIPFREDIPYIPGKTISLADSRYQIQVQTGEEAATPPPFFNEDYKRALEELKKKIKEKEEILFNAEKSLEKRRATIDSMDSFIRTKLIDRNKREIEVEILHNKLSESTSELTKKKEEIEDYSDKLISLQEHIDKLKTEDRYLSEGLTRSESELNRVKGEIERHHIELRGQKEQLTSLQLEEKKAKNALVDLKKESEEVSLQMTEEMHKVQDILIKTNTALREKQKVEIKIEQARKDFSETSRSLEYLNQKLEDQEKLRVSELAKVQELGLDVERLEQKITKHKQNLVIEIEKEQHLQKRNEELRIELIKVEDRLSSKKNICHQLDFQNQDNMKRLNQIKSDIETSTLHLQDLTTEEKSLDLKMLCLRQDHEQFSKKIYDEKKSLIAFNESLKVLHSQELESLSDEIRSNKSDLSELQRGLEQLQKTEKELIQTNKGLHYQKTELEAKIESLIHRKLELEKSSVEIIDHNAALTNEKCRIENDISTLRLKLLDCEAHIRKTEESAKLELEILRRDERQRIETERQNMLADILSQQQKHEIQIDARLRENENKIHLKGIECLLDSQKIIKDAQTEASRIIEGAAAKEEAAVKEGTRRLNEIAQEVFEREQKANFRITEAQNYYEQKEREAELMLAKSKKHCHELIRESETNLLKDLEERKSRIKGFLTQRQIKGQKHIETLEAAQVRRLEKREAIACRFFENYKRREYKKIARLKQEAIFQSATVKDQLLKSAKEEKEKSSLELIALKSRQETELADAKKTFLEQLSSMKMRQQKSMEEELRRQKEDFENTKKVRVQNATHAVMSALISINGPLPDDQDKIRDKVQSALELAISGNNNVHNKKMSEQILEYNPLSKKSIWPVLKKYAFQYGVPTTLAFTMIFDIGDLRSEIFLKAGELLKPTESASDKFVESQRGEWKEKYTFKPSTTVGYKDSYADNVLYTTDFYDVMESESFQNDWLLAVNDYLVTTLEFSEDVAINFISSEGVMIREMWLVRNTINPKFMDVGIKKIKELEEKHMGWLADRFSNPERLQSFMKYKKEFYNNYYKEKFQSSQNRALATLEEPNL